MRASGCVLLLALGLLPAGRADGRPNIVFIISDDHDFNHLGFMGNSMMHTPHLDRLARGGAVFTTAHLPMSRCHPTLASFLSGRWPHQTGIYYNYGKKRLDPQGSLPGLLKEAGYATYVEGKYWEGDPRAMGFTHGKGKTAKTFVRKGQDRLFGFIDEVGGRQPLFIWWAPLIPHTPHNPPERYLNLFKDREIPVPSWIEGEWRETFLEKERLSLAMEAWLDDSICRLEEKLRAKGIYENTLFAFLIDNGWCNGLVSKGSPFEQGVRTPMLLTWPGKIAKGRRFDTLVSTLDLYPTLLDYAGVEIPDSAVGKSLRPVIEGRSQGGRERLFGAVYPAYAEGDQTPEGDVYALYVRDRRWKYILFVQDVVSSRNRKYFRIQHIGTAYPERVKGDEDLYDLEADPHELNDLAGDSGQADRIAGMRAAVLRWWKETGGKPIRGFEE